MDEEARDRARAEARWMMALRRFGGLPLLLAIAAPLAAGLLLIGQAALLASVLDRAVVDGAAAGALTLPIAAIAGLLLIRSMVSYAAERAGITAAERIKLTLRDALFARLLARRPDWTAARASGGMSAAIVDQVEALDGFFARFLPAMIQASLLPLVFAAAVMPVDWFVSLLFLLTAPLIPVFMALVGWGAQAATDAQANALSRLSGYFADRLRGLLTLKLFGRTAAEAGAMRLATDELRSRTLGVLRIAFLSSAVLEFFAALGVAGVALYVGLSYLGFVDLRLSPLTLQAGLFCLLMAPEVYQPLRLLAAHYHDRARAKAAVSEIARYFGELPLADPVPPATSGTMASPAATGLMASRRPCAGRLEISGLTLRTPDAGFPVLTGADLTVPAGEHVALLGPSGIGKSTLVEAIARLREAEGTISLDGEALEDLDEAVLRARVAFLGQRPRLFHGTIADNIRFGRRDASDGQIREAARLARVNGFAENLPQGLATPIGEGGIGLSGGEAHRVALARIYLRRPALILLDEPTAHLDLATEAAVLDGLAEFAAGGTLVVATHSAAVAARMHRTLRIEGGRLIPGAPALRLSNRLVGAA